MKKVFLSYAHEDAQVAQELYSSFADIEVSGCMDQVDIASGAALAHQVKDAIREASAVVIFVSPRSVDSQWINFEVGVAMALDKRIIPVFIGDTGIEGGFPDWLREYEFIDARLRPIQEVALEIARATSVE